MSTHVNAQLGDIAKTVLLPGDPLRAKHIADTFLSQVEPYNTVRNMLGFTGITPQKEKISVQGSGMGMPSLAIYVNELINNFGVNRIIRLGSCGGLQEHTELRDIIIAVGSCSDSAMNNRIFYNMSFAPIADFELLYKAKQVAQELNIPVQFGNVLATDNFYDDAEPPGWKIFSEYGVLAIEMETAILYTIAAKKKIQALTILTVSDKLVTGEQLDAQDRQESFNQMVEIALGL